MNRIAKNQRHQGGFSTVELLVVVAMSVIITAVAVPSYINMAAYFRAAGDLRSLNGIVAQAKMSAAANFTHARAYADLASNTFHLEIWNKTNACWQTDGDTANNCTVAASPVVSLSQGVTFGVGSVTVGPTPGTATIAQAPLCIKKYAGNPGGTGGTNATTACIEFNSRGIPVDSSNAPVATGALYLTNQKTVEAVTVSATGSIQSWSGSPTCGAASCWYGQ